MVEEPVYGCCGNPHKISYYVAKTWGYFTGAAASTLLYSSSMIGVPFFLGHVIDAFKSDFLVPTAPHDFFSSPEFYWTLGLGCGYTGIQGINALRNYFIKNTAINMQNKILPTVLERAVELTYSENQNLKKGEIEQNLSKLQNNLEIMLNAMIYGSSSVFELCMASVVVGIKFEWEFLLYLFAIAGVNSGSMIMMGLLTRTLDREKIKVDESLLHVIGDIVHNYENIKSNSKEDYILDALARPKIVDWFNKNTRANSRNEFFSMGKSMLLGIIASVVCLRALHLIYSNPRERSIDDMIFIVTYLFQIINSSSSFDSLLKKGMGAYRNLRVVVDILDKEIEPKPDIEYEDIHDQILRMGFERVNFSLGPAVPWLSDEERLAVQHDENTVLLQTDDPQPIPMLGPLNIDFVSGIFTGIVGESGSGKTMIARLLFRFLEVMPKQGEIMIDFLGQRSQNIKTLPLVSFRKKICYTPQDSSIFDATLMQNITFEDEAAVDPAHYGQAIRMAQLGEKEKNATSEEMKKFSGGQRQRIGLARAFYRYLSGCRFFIFDESTSALDAGLQSSIMEEIYGLTQRGCIVVFVTHRLGTIKAADQIVCLYKEKIGKIEHTRMKCERKTEEMSAFDRLRRTSEEFNRLVEYEFGETFGANPFGLFALKGSSDTDHYQDRRSNYRKPFAIN